MELVKASLASKRNGSWKRPHLWWRKNNTHKQDEIHLLAGRWSCWWCYRTKAYRMKRKIIMFNGEHSNRKILSQLTYRHKHLPENPRTTICDSYYGSINCSLGSLHQWNCKVDHTQLIRMRLSSSFEIVFLFFSLYVCFFSSIYRPQCLHQCFQIQSFVRIQSTHTLISIYCGTFHFFPSFNLLWHDLMQSQPRKKKSYNNIN